MRKRIWKPRTRKSKKHIDNWRTGNGKSTLVNVLTDTNQFKESSYGTSETRGYQVEEFEYKGIKYRVIDSIGIGDTKLSRKEVLFRIAEGVYQMKDGINQVLFVTSGRFDKKEIEAFESLKKVILESDIVKHTTIIRTKFPKFKNESECKKDRELLMRENEAIKEILESCGERIIHVDNPSVDAADDEDEKNIYLKKREKSREIILESLSSDECGKRYKLYPKSSDQLYLRIANYIKRKLQLEKELEIIEKTAEEEREKIKNKLEDIKNKVIEETVMELGEKEALNYFVEVPSKDNSHRCVIS